MRVHESILVPVSSIRYSQDCIQPYFEDTNRTLQETVEQIVSGRLCPQDFPHMIVWLYGHLFFTHNNRLLWVYQKAKVEKVVAKLLYPRQICSAGRKWMTFEYTDNYSRYKDPLYVPVIRNHRKSMEEKKKHPPRRSRNPVTNESFLKKTCGADEQPPAPPASASGLGTTRWRKNGTNCFPLQDAPVSDEACMEESVVEAGCGDVKPPAPRTYPFVSPSDRRTTRFQIQSAVHLHEVPDSDAGGLKESVLKTRYGDLKPPAPRTHPPVSRIVRRITRSQIQSTAAKMDVDASNKRSSRK